LFQSNAPKIIFLSHKQILETNVGSICKKVKKSKMLKIFNNNKKYILNENVPLNSIFRVFIFKVKKPSNCF